MTKDEKILMKNGLSSILYNKNWEKIDPVSPTLKVIIDSLINYSETRTESNMYERTAERASYLITALLGINVNSNLQTLKNIGFDTELINEIRNSETTSVKQGEIFRNTLRGIILTEILRDSRKTIMPANLIISSEQGDYILEKALANPKINFKIDYSKVKFVVVAGYNFMKIGSTYNDSKIVFQDPNLPKQHDEFMAETTIERKIVRKCLDSTISSLSFGFNNSDKIKVLGDKNVR